MNTPTPKQLPIMIVGEAWGREEADTGIPFSGASGKLLRNFLDAAGIDEADCYLTYVFNMRPPGGKLEGFHAPKSEALQGYPKLTAKIQVGEKFGMELLRLEQEIEEVNPNVIIALGATSLWGVCKVTGIKKYRGAPMQSPSGKKVIATYSPAAIFRQWKLRPIAIADIAKAARESKFPEVRRPNRFIYMEPTIQDVEDFYLKYIEPVPVIGCDIETKQLTITEVGFSPTVDRALVIPFYRRNGNPNYWETPEEEFEAWQWVRRICDEKRLTGQNFSYDLQYLWSKNHIPCPQIEDDTMILHHALYPEMEKSLGFLGSIYTNEPAWKFMRKNETTKKED